MVKEKGAGKDFKKGLCTEGKPMVQNYRSNMFQGRKIIQPAKTG